jgi:uncharacterized FlaG/YvyC family protein
MESVNALAAMLGEENQERIKNELTDFIIQECKDEIQDRDFYLISNNIDRWMDELYGEIHYELEKTLKEMCIKRINEKFNEIIQKLGI